MRVIAGMYKGRHLVAPKGSMTRPTGDRVKEAVFSMIGPFFSGGVCLDLFAGSGALGIEAVSRGMDHAVFVDKASMATVEGNVKVLGMQNSCTMMRMPYTVALRQLEQQKARFDVVFIDPPYKMGLALSAMETLVLRRLLNPGATLVVEMDCKTETPAITMLTLKREALYGLTKICIYRHAKIFSQIESTYDQK